MMLFALRRKTICRSCLKKTRAKVAWVKSHEFNAVTRVAGHIQKLVHDRILYRGHL
jgi:hypothetical protein